MKHETRYLIVLYRDIYKNSDDVPLDYCDSAIWKNCGSLDEAKYHKDYLSRTVDDYFTCGRKWGIIKRTITLELVE